MRAGLVAETFANWLEIEHLYVDEELILRFLQMTEEKAKKRNCLYAFVDILGFQAPNFYKNHGYKEVFSLKDFPHTGKRYYYTKEL